jgi:hypothetical protein
LAHLHGLSHSIVDPARTLGALVGFEQDAGVGELAGRGVPASIRFFNSARSVSLKITGYFFFIMDKHTHCILE